MDYKQILTNVIASAKIPIEHGKAIIVIWKNKEHLEEWDKSKIAASEDVRITSLPLEQIRLFNLKEEDEAHVCVLAIAFGVKADYSDTNCIFRMTVRRTE